MRCHRPKSSSLYAKSPRTKGIFLDPVYTGKALFGMIQQLRRDPKGFGERVIFRHSGGLFGLFPKTNPIGPVL
jgi:D-cysteine desulfhydrase